MRGWLDRYALPGSLVVVWLGAALLERLETPSLAVEFVAALLVALLTVWAFQRRAPGRRVATLIAVCALPVGIMLLAAVRSIDPRTAIVGASPQHQGWLMWVSLLGWFAVSAIGAERRDLRRVTETLAALGTATGAWALVQLAEVLPHYPIGINRVQAFADTRTSLGEMLIVTLFATAAVLSRPEVSRRWRTVLLAGGAIQLAALLVSRAKGSWVAAIVGLLVFGFTAAPAPGRARVLRAVCGTMLVGFVLGFAVLSAASVGTFGPSLFAKANSVLDGRGVTWEQASQDLVANPLLGVGPSHFAGPTKWSVTPDGNIDALFSYDAHSILIDWMLGAGIIGFLAFGLAAIFVARTLARAVETSAHSPSVRWLLAGAAASLVAMLSSWPDPLATVSITVVVGLMAGLEIRATGDERALGRAWSLIAPSAATVFAVTALIALWPGVAAEYTHATHRVDMLPSLQARLQRAAESTGDHHWLATEALLVDTSGMVPASVVQKLYHDAETNDAAADSWDPSVGVLVMDALWRNHEQLPREQYWRESSAVAHDEPADQLESSLWRFLLARAAISSSRPDAAEYVQRFEDSPHSEAAGDALRAMLTEEQPSP